MSKVIITKSSDETQKIAQEFSNIVRAGGVVALYGDLGAGKTTFVQGLAKGLEIKKRIISPTFIIVRSYKFKTQNSKLKTKAQSSNLFYHIDLYRAESLNDVLNVGIQEIISDPKNIVVIEWPEKLEKLLPNSAVKIYFEYIDENTRKIQIT